MRKLALRSFLSFLKIEDKLRASPYYVKVVQCAVEVYLHLFDTPIKDDTTVTNEKNLSQSELKKLRNKQRKAQRKAEQENAQVAQTQIKKTPIPKKKELRIQGHLNRNNCCLKS